MSAAPAASVAGRIAGTVRADIRELAAYPVAHAEGCIKLDAMECPYELPDAVRDDIARTVRDGLEAAPDAFLGLFSGENIGKMLVRL